VAILLVIVIGGYIVAGDSRSNNGDVSGNHGGSDYWVVKLNDLGNIQWQECLGDTSWDAAYSIKQTIDEGYIVAGGGGPDIPGTHGGGDYWIVKLDEFGDSLWQKCLGGSGNDHARSILQTTDGDYFVAGSTHSNNGNVSGNHGSYDYWVVKLCFGDTITIEVTNPSNYCFYTLTATDGFNNYLWNNGETTQSIDVTEGGVYSVQAINEFGCSSEAEINAPTPPPIPLSIEIPNPDYCYTTELIATGDFNSYLWSTGETTQSITITTGGSYQVTATGILGCQSEATLEAPYPLEPYNQSTICMVTLDEENDKNIIVYEPDLDVGIDSVMIYRLNNNTSEYEWIGSNSINIPGIFTDIEANPVQQNYQYKISIKDTCEKISELSSKHQTILLQANIGINNETNLLWNPYIGFEYPNFGIYRSIGNQEYFLIANVPNKTYTFTDTNPPYGGKKYQVRVEKSEPCNPEKSFSFVSSNTVILQTAVVSDLNFDDFDVYPNPFEDNLRIKRTKIHGEANIELINTYGIVVGNYIIPPGKERITFSTKHLIPGIYFLHINDFVCKRIVK